MKKTLLVDIDDTLISSYELPLLNRFLNTTYTENDFVQYIQEKLPRERAEEFYAYLLKTPLYADTDVQIKSGAIKGLKTAQEHFNVYLCSDHTFWEKPWNSDVLFQAKYEFLRRNFPFISPLNHIFLKEKHMLSADIMIDDRIENFGKNIKTKILFTCYHNQQIPQEKLDASGIVRASNWEEITKILIQQR